MKHILFLLLCLPVLAYAQFPANPNKIRLGNQTTADGLIVRTAAAPSWTPSTINNAWIAFDTVSAVLYYYEGGTWNAFASGSGGNVTGVSLSNDTLYITTPDSTFSQLLRNFANSNLTFTGNRVHNLSTRTLTIADGGTYPTFQQSAATDGFTLASSATDLIAQTPGLLQIENSDTITITADRIRMNAADTRILQVAKDNALNRLVALDSLTNKLYYVDKASISSSGSGTVTGTGTTGTIPVWSSSSALGDSPLTVSSGSVIAGGTGFFRFPVGTTAQRPGTPQSGDARYNSTLGNLDFYGASAWENPLRSTTATGLGTAGRVFYADAAGRAAADDNLYWDSGSDRLGIGAAAAYDFEIKKGVNGVVAFAVTNTTNNTNARSSFFASTPQASGNVNAVTQSMASNYTLSTFGGTYIANGVWMGRYGENASAAGPLLFANNNAGTGLARSIEFHFGDGTTTNASTQYLSISLSEMVTNENSRDYDVRIESDGDANNFFSDGGGNAIGIGNNAPQRKLHVTGEARITDLTTDTPTQIVGADADGDLGSITVGSGLSLSSGTLSATGGTGTTNLAFSGASSPVTLTSDTGTDVIFAAGSGLALSQSGGTATYSRTYSLTHITISGGSTFFGTTAERPDNDTPGSATTSTVGSDFSVSGSTIDYTGAGGALLRVEGSISFSVADDGDYYLSIYKEGSELGATSMRVSCVAGNYYSISLPATTTTGSTNNTFDLRIATVSGNSTTTMHRYGFIIERVY